MPEILWKGVKYIVYVRSNASLELLLMILSSVISNSCPSVSCTGEAVLFFWFEPLYSLPSVSYFLFVCLSGMGG